MLNSLSRRPCGALNRRDFLRVSAVGAATLVSSGVLQAQSGGGQAKHCILLILVGGPSQLDTWDLKPNAPSHIRGPFRPIRTAVPGIDVCEHFPLMAKMADRFAIVRSLHHEEAAIHETGLQLMQTGASSSRAQPTRTTARCCRICVGHHPTSFFRGQLATPARTSATARTLRFLDHGTNL